MRGRKPNIYTSNALRSEDNIMAFANNKKLKLIAAMVGDEMAYIKGSKSYFSQGELKGKKYGMKLSGYLPDPGTSRDGIVANPDAINEPEINAYLNNKNNSCEVDLWNELTDVENFMEEIGAPRAKNLALATQKDIMKEAMFESAQAVVVTSVGFGLLTKSSKALGELGVAGKRLSFQSPNIMGEIAEAGLSRFIPSENMKKIYEDAYLGKYSGAEQIEIANTPIIDTTNMDSAPTISADQVVDANSNILGLEPITSITLSNVAKVVEGMPYKLSGLKIRNAAGIETDQDYVIIAHTEKRGSSSVLIIPELRIATPGTGYNNANAVISSAAITAALSGDTATFTLTPMLTASKKYAIGQVRTDTCLGFDQYRFENLPGSEAEDVGTFGNVTLKLMAFGDGKNGVKLVRIDFPYAAKIYDHRESVTTYTLVS